MIHSGQLIGDGACTDAKHDDRLVLGLATRIFIKSALGRRALESLLIGNRVIGNRSMV